MYNVQCTKEEKALSSAFSIYIHRTSLLLRQSSNRQFFKSFFSFYLHISKNITNFAAEFTPMPYFAAEGGGFFTY